MLHEKNKKNESTQNLKTDTQSLSTSELIATGIQPPIWLFTEQNIVNAYLKFQRSLLDIEDHIKMRNKGLRYPYKVLMPSRIPYSIAIWILIWVVRLILLEYKTNQYLDIEIYFIIVRLCISIQLNQSKNNFNLNSFSIKYDKETVNSICNTLFFVIIGKYIIPMYLIDSLLFIYPNADLFFSSSLIHLNYVEWRQGKNDTNILMGCQTCFQEKENPKQSMSKSNFDKWKE